jgi:hypothetical protein
VAREGELERIHLEGGVGSIGQATRSDRDAKGYDAGPNWRGNSSWNGGVWHWHWGLAH